jgi:hypothetical protein
MFPNVRGRHGAGRTPENRMSDADDAKERCGGRGHGLPGPETGFTRVESSFQRKLESHFPFRILLKGNEIPAFAGMTDVQPGWEGL